MSQQKQQEESIASAIDVAVDNDDLGMMMMDMSAVTLEERAMQVMGLIQQFITFLRCDTNNSGGIGNKQSKFKHSSSSSSPGLLFTKLCHVHDTTTTPTTKPNIVLQIQTLLQPLESLQQQQVSFTLFNGNDNNDPDDERRNMIYHVVLPLIHLLYHCCHCLDHHDDEDDDENDCNHQHNRSSNNNNNNSKTEPPLLLFSIQNYTDIAALIEIWVCYSCLIHLESNILLSISDRCRFMLPKSLQGRLSRSALVWATEYDQQQQQQQQQTNHNKNCDEENPLSVTCHDPQDFRQTILLLRRFQTILELRRGIVSVSRLLLLDRFRPMLLPRHVTDLYAAMAQADHLMEVEDEKNLWIQLRQTQPNNIVVRQDHRHHGNDNDNAGLGQQQLLALVRQQIQREDASYRQACRRLGFVTHTSTATATAAMVESMIRPQHPPSIAEASTTARRMANIDSSNHHKNTIAGSSHSHEYVMGDTSALAVVHATLQARTCQTLLRHGTKAPGWLRQRCTKLLHYLTCYHMSSLIHVYVVEASTTTIRNNHRENDTSQDMESTVLVGASLRLAHAILFSAVTPLPSQQSQHHGQDMSTNRKNNYDHNAKLICQQLVHCLSMIVDPPQNYASLFFERGETCTTNTKTTIRNMSNHYSNETNQQRSIPHHIIFAYIHTIQAVLEQMSSDMIRQYFLPIFCQWHHKNMYHYDDNQHGINHVNEDSTLEQNILNMLRQLRALLTLPRPDFARLLRLFLLPISPQTWSSSTSSQQQGTQMPQPSTWHHLPTTLLSQVLYWAISHNSNAEKIEVISMTSSTNDNDGGGDSVNNNDCFSSKNTTSHILILQEEAKTLFRLLVQAMSQSTFTSKQANQSSVPVPGTDILCLALIHAVACNHTNIEQKQQHNSLPVLQIPTSSSRVNDDEHTVMINTVRGMEQRAQWLIRNLFVTIPHHHHHTTTAASATELAPSRFFQWLLWLYFRSSSSLSSPNELHHNASSKAVYYKVHQQMQLAVMVLLPPLCEQVPPESLLLRATLDNDQKDEILPMIKLILVSSCADKATLLQPCMENNESERDEAHIAPDPTLTAAQRVFRDFLFGDFDANKFVVDVDDESQPMLRLPQGLQNSRLSICSIVLSLLVAMLELGVQRRPLEQEELLKSLMPSLEHLATCTELSSSVRNILDVNGGQNDNDDDLDADQRNSFAICAEIAEMASLAMALIVARDREVDFDDRRDVNVSETTDDSVSQFETILNQSQIDLRSDQPPIRARAMVALRHFVRGEYFTKPEPTMTNSSNVEIVELSREGSTQVSDSDRMIHRILVLCFVALSDCESFVYLASIQTIVAAADINPRLVLPKLLAALCRGVIPSALADCVSMKFENTSPTTDKLTVEQRIKLAEALLFTIRRRASVYEYIPMLMNYMVHGTDLSTSAVQNSDKKTLDNRIITMQAATHDYFIGQYDTYYNNNAELASQERMDAQTIRVATGGPLFKTEESDILRASYFQVMADLIAVSHPAVIANYCSTIVSVTTNALSLDVSRPVRRAAAQLSRELYAAVLREIHELGDSHDHGRLMTLELVASGEEKLWTALQYSMTATGMVGVEFGFDPATIARCEEAMVLRDECQGSGIFAAVKLIVAARQRENRNPSVRLLKELLRNGAIP